MSNKTGKIHLADLLNKLGFQEVRIEIPVKEHEETEYKTFFGEASELNRDDFVPKNAVVSRVGFTVVADIECAAYDFPHKEKGLHIIEATLNDEEFEFLESLCFNIGTTPDAFITSVIKDYLEEKEG